jgi:hypothetical protein
MVRQNTVILGYDAVDADDGETPTVITNQVAGPQEKIEAAILNSGDIEAIQEFEEQTGSEFWLYELVPVKRLTFR